MKKFYWYALGLFALCLAMNGRTFADGDDIVFISQPVLVAEVGELYQYDAEAMSRNGDLIMYELRKAPLGMTLNPQTGLVLWTPAETGTFRVRIRASANHDNPNHGGDADQEYTVRVLDGPPSVVSGLVRNSDGLGIGNVRLRLFEEGSHHFLFSAMSDSDGQYEFPAVNAGTYLLRAQPRENHSLYASQWYDRARRIQDATLIVVSESSHVIINVTLLARDSMNVRFNLSGTVRDTLNAPIAGAKVLIFKARHHDDLDESGLNFEGLDDHHRDQELEATAWTDSNGNYSVQLRPRRYVLAAWKEGFTQQFWDHQTSVLDADRLNLISDSTGIDFDLLPAEPSNGSISGRITVDGDTTGVRAHVIGFQRSTPNGGFTGFLRHTETNSLGQYTLSRLRSGYYVVLAVPEEEFLPTFYDTTGGTVVPANAFPVAVNNSAVNNINIRVQPDTVLGMNRIRGTVTAGNSSVSGAIVFASASDNTVVGAAISEKGGAYTLVGFAPGSYTLSAVKPGYSQPSAPSVSIVQFGGVPTTVTSNLALAFTPTTVATESQPVEFALSQNYPNPFNPSTKIGFTVRASGLTTLKVFDVLGRNVATVVNEELKSGSYEKVFTADGLASGVYFYQLKNGSLVTTRRMMILK